MKRYLILFFSLAILFSGWVSCSKMNDLHDPYLRGGEIIYLARFDSIHFYSGHNRIKFEYWLSDPKVKKCDISWALGTEKRLIDLVQTPDPEHPGVFYIDGLGDGAVNFVYYNRDAEMQMTSVVQRKTQYSYGNFFLESTVFNRTLKTAVYTNSSSIMQITWSGKYDYSDHMEVVYEDKNGVERTVRTPIMDDHNQVILITQLQNFPAGSAFKYRTAFLPEATAIDTFYTPWKDYEYTAPVLNLTSTYSGTTLTLTLQGDYVTYPIVAEIVYTNSNKIEQTVDINVNSTGKATQALTNYPSKSTLKYRTRITLPGTSEYLYSNWDTHTGP